MRKASDRTEWLRIAFWATMGIFISIIPLAAFRELASGKKTKGDNIMIIAQMIRCCFCGKLIDFKKSNNPEPIMVKDGGRCCPDCNKYIVIPLRTTLQSIAENKENA